MLSVRPLLRSCRHRRLLAVAVAVFIAAGFDAWALAQVPQLEIPRRPRFRTEQQRTNERLQLDDQQLRTDIAGNRVSRQAEVSRLEAQLERLDERLRTLERRQRTSDLAGIVDLLNTAAPRAQPAAGDAAPAAEQRPAASASPDAASAPADRQEQAVRLLVGDYLLALRGELLEAHGESLRATDRLRILERFVAKGQATAGQLELQQIQQQQAALRVVRLQHQWDGLQRLLPPSLAGEFAALTAPAAERD